MRYDFLPASCPAAVPADHLALEAATAAYLGRYRGTTRVHAESDLRIFLTWCTGQDMDPLAGGGALTSKGTCAGCGTCAATSPRPSPGACRVVICFYRVCVIDQLLPHSPADYVRRPLMPPESQTLGLGHLRFEALITTARLSDNPNDFALIAMLGLLGYGSSRPAVPVSAILARHTATGSCECAARAAKSSSSRCHLRLPALSTAPSQAVTMSCNWAKQRKAPAPMAP